MAVTADYSGYVPLQTFDINTGFYQADPGVTDLFTVTDSFDGASGDGIETAGETLTDQTYGMNATYSGYTINGDPIVQYDGDPSYVVLTNNPAAIGLTSGTATEENYTYCFSRGTQISTALGVCGVEMLKMGDAILTAEGKIVMVKWIGRQTINSQFAKLNGSMPVCIQTGALGENIPARDLYVSPDHALLVDGILVHASALINDRTIYSVNEWKGDIEYFHVETETHEIILAEGAPAETFIDNVSRRRFDNWQEYDALYPGAAPMQELELPRVKCARQLPKAIFRRLSLEADRLLGKGALVA